MLKLSNLVMLCRQRQDDKWEHDLFEQDEPQLLSMVYSSTFLAESWFLNAVAEFGSINFMLF